MLLIIAPADGNGSPRTATHFGPGFRWQPRSVAFWDNRCAQHRALWDYWPHTRSGNRVTIKGEKPV